MNSEFLGISFPMWVFIAMISYVIFIVCCLWMKYCCTTLCHVSSLNVQCRWFEGKCEPYACPHCQHLQWPFSIRCCKTSHNFVDQESLGNWNKNCNPVNCCGFKVTVEKIHPLEEIKITNNSTSDPNSKIQSI